MNVRFQQSITLNRQSVTLCLISCFFCYTVQDVVKELQPYPGQNKRQKGQSMDNRENCTE